MRDRPIVVVHPDHTLLRWDAPRRLWLSAPGARVFLPWLAQRARLWWWQGPQARSGILSRPSALQLSAMLGVSARWFAPPRRGLPPTLPEVVREEWRWISAEWPTTAQALVEREEIAQHWIACDATERGTALTEAAQHLQDRYGWPAPAWEQDRLAWAS